MPARLFLADPPPHLFDLHSHTDLLLIRSLLFYLFITDKFPIAHSHHYCDYVLSSSSVFDKSYWIKPTSSNTSASSSQFSHITSSPLFRRTLFYDHLCSHSGWSSILENISVARSNWIIKFNLAACVSLSLSMDSRISDETNLALFVHSPAATATRDGKYATLNSRHPFYYRCYLNFMVRYLYSLSLPFGHSLSLIHFAEPISNLQFSIIKRRIQPSDRNKKTIGRKETESDWQLLYRTDPQVSGTNSQRAIKNLIHTVESREGERDRVEFFFINNHHHLAQAVGPPRRIFSFHKVTRIQDKPREHHHPRHQTVSYLFFRRCVALVKTRTCANCG